MIVPYVMLCVGLFLVYMEFFLPGGIMGACGAILLVSGFVFFAMESQSMWATVAFTLGTLFGAGAVMKVALKRIQMAEPESSVYLDADQEGYRAPSYDSQAIGKEGVALSDLKPSGHVSIDGKRMQAVSKAGYVEKGSEIVVIEGKGAYLIVRKNISEIGSRT